jgi:hypothetical protein
MATANHSTNAKSEGFQLWRKLTRDSFLSLPFPSLPFPLTRVVVAWGTRGARVNFLGVYWRFFNVSFRIRKN